MDMQTQSREPRRGLTFEDVWAALMESRDKSEKDKREYDEKFEKFERARQASLERYEKATMRLEQVVGQAMEETAKAMRATDKRIGYLSNRFGELAEHMVAPSIADKFNALGYHFNGISEPRKILDEQGRVIAEIDILLENDEYVIAVEVKAKPDESDIYDHIGRIEVLRGYKDKRNDNRVIHGAVAGAIFPKSVKKAALKTGFYVIEQSGDSVKIDIPEGFKPREW
jgi:hypothetical protein